MRHLVLLLAMILAAAALPASAAGAAKCDRFASLGGDNGSSGSRSEPLRTPQRLADMLRPGQMGCLRGGTYTGTGPVGYVLDLDEGGRQGAPVTIRSAPGGRATLHGIVVVARGADHVRLQDLDLDAERPFRPLEGQVGISVFATDTQLTRNRITSSRARSCVLLGSNTDQGGASRTLIRGNRFERCGSLTNGQLDHAIYAAESRRARIVDNVFVGTAGYAVHLYPNAQQSLVRGNVMLNNGGGVIFAGDYQHASSGNRVVHNLIALSRRAPEVGGWFPSEAGRRNVARSNCIAPGQYPYSDERRGWRQAANRFATADACLQSAPRRTVARLADASPAALSELAAVLPSLTALISARPASY